MQLMIVFAIVESKLSAMRVSSFATLRMTSLYLLRMTLRGGALIMGFPLRGTSLRFAFTTLRFPAGQAVQDDTFAQDDMLCVLVRVFPPFFFYCILFNALLSRSDCICVIATLLS